MNKLQITIFYLVIVLIFGCDTHQATFEDSIPLQSLQTIVYPEYGGTVHPSEGKFSSSDRVEIEARPSEQFVFKYWGDDLTGNANPEHLTFNKNKIVTAHFLPKNYDLEIEIVGEGYIREAALEWTESDSTDIIIETIRLTAEAEDGWFFDHWEGDLTGSGNPEIIDVDNVQRMKAVFDRIDTGEYIINFEIEGEGTVNIYPERDIYEKGDEVILTALANSGWKFLEWGGDLSGLANSKSIEIDENLITTAHFGPSEDPLLEINQQPQITIAGSRIDPAPELRMINEHGDPIIGAKVNVKLNKDTFMSGSSTSLTTDYEGIALFDNLSIERTSPGYVLTFETDEPEITPISSIPFQVVSARADPSLSSADVSENGSVGEPTEIHIALNDVFENSVSGVANQLSVEVRGTNTAAPVVRSRGNGRYIAHYTPTRMGMDQIVIELNGEPLPGSPFRSEVGVGSPSEIRIIQHPESVTAGSVLSSAPSVQITDKFENKITNMTVVVEPVGTSFASRSSTSAETNSDGIATFNNLVINKAGNDFKIIFRVNDLRKTSNTFNIKATPADPSLSKAEVPDGVTGEDTIIYINLQDSLGNTATGKISDLTVEIYGTNKFIPFIKGENTSGTFAARYTPKRAGIDQVEIKYNGSSINGSPFKSLVIPAEANPYKSSVTVTPEKVNSGEFSIIKVQPRDNDGNPIGGLTPDEIKLDLKGDASASSFYETSTTGTYKTEVKSSSVGEVKVSVSVNGITLDNSPGIFFEAGDPHEIIIIHQPEDTRSGNPIKGPPAVKIIDENGWEVPEIPVHVSELGHFKFSGSNLEVTTNQSGVAEFNNLIIHHENEWFTLVFSVTGLEDAVSNPFRVTENASEDVEY